MYTVHPRSRGEHSKFDTTTLVSGRSSPLTRGTPIFTAASIFQSPFIPAHAGNTWHRTPRSNQEYRSSPLTRGTPHLPSESP